LVTSVDGKLFYRNYRKPFYAQIAVSVEIRNLSSFETLYINLVDALNKKFNLSFRRKTVDSRFLAEVLAGKEALRKTYIREFIEKISPQIGRIYVMHTSIPPSKIPAVKCYGGKEQKEPIEFIKSLTGAYNHCVLWKILDKNYYDFSSRFLVDFFEGDITRAWEKIVSVSPQMEAYFLGDECNPTISIADLLCKYVEYELAEKRLRLGTDQIRQCFANSPLNVEPVFIDDLSMITPCRKEPIRASKFIHHPIVFVFCSQQLNKEKEVIKSIGLYDKLLNFAFERHACLKFFNYDNTPVDATYMSKGDIFVTIGDKGRSTAKYFIKELGIDAELYNALKLKSKFKNNNI